MGKPRDMQPHTPQAIVTRTVQSRLLLRPSVTLNARVIGCFAKAQENNPTIKIYNLVALSNHPHLILEAPTAQVISDFMRDAKSLLAQEAGRIHDWRQCAFWQRRFDNVPIVDAKALEERLEYQLVQGFKEGLVADPRDWPGVHAAKQLSKGRFVMKGKYVDRTALYRARLRGEKVTEKDFTRDIKLRLSPIPGWEHLSPREYGRRIRKLLRSGKKKFAPPSDSFLGADAILKQDPHSRPSTTKRGIKPICHASEPASWRDGVRAHWEFVQQYRIAATTTPRDLSAYPGNCFLPGGFFIEG